MINNFWDDKISVEKSLECHQYCYSHIWLRLSEVFQPLSADSGSSMSEDLQVFCGVGFFSTMMKTLVGFCLFISVARSVLVLEKIWIFSHGR